MVVRGAKIEEISSSKGFAPENGWQVVDVRGGLICPGFIDIHLNGGGGALVMDGTLDSICKIARAHASFGTTAMLPTTVAWGEDAQNKAIGGILEAMQKGTGGAKPLGVHMEGPFLNTQKAGAHNPKYLLEPSIPAFDRFHSAAKGTLKIMTLSPELPHSEELIRYASAKGVIVSAGHTMASYGQAVDSIRAGVHLCAHLFNAMPTISAREPGLALAALTSPEMFVELITDGVHVHPALINLTIRTKGTSGVLIVTDATPPSGTHQKTWQLEGETVIIKGYTGYLEDGTIAGSALTMGQALKVTSELTKLPLADLLPMTSLNQARLLGISAQKGSLEVGKDADIVVLSNDGNLDVQLTMVEGVVVFSQLSQG